MASTPDASLTTLMSISTVASRKGQLAEPMLLEAAHRRNLTVLLAVLPMRWDEAIDRLRAYVEDN